MTHAERKELEALEEKRRKQEIQQQKNSSIQDKVNQRKAMIDAKVNASGSAKLSVKEQMELLQQAKNMLDVGILTQDEFEQKKKEILNG